MNIENILGKYVEITPIRADDTSLYFNYPCRGIFVEDPSYPNHNVALFYSNQVNHVNREHDYHNVTYSGSFARTFDSWERKVKIKIIE